MSETQTLGPCTECGTPRDACTAPDYCCEECLHFPPDWDGYEPTQAAEPTGDLREQIARWLWDRYGSGSLMELRGCQADADELLALPAVRDALAAQETVRRVERLAAELEARSEFHRGRAVGDLEDRFEGQAMGEEDAARYLRALLDES